MVPLAAAVSFTVLAQLALPGGRWPGGAKTDASCWGSIASVGFYALTAAVGRCVERCFCWVWDRHCGAAGSLGAGSLRAGVAPPLPTEKLDALGDRDRLELTYARLKLQNDLRTTALQTVGGLAIIAGAILAFQQLTEDRQQSTAARELTVQGQASERFTRAVEQLGSERTEVQAWRDIRAGADRPTGTRQPPGRDRGAWSRTFTAAVNYRPNPQHPHRSKRNQ